jgi:hypothetical protein
MDVAERQGKLEQEGDQPEARADAPYGSKPTHLAAVNVKQEPHL